MCQSKEFTIALKFIEDILVPIAEGFGSFNRYARAVKMAISLIKKAQKIFNSGDEDEVVNKNAKRAFVSDGMATEFPDVAERFRDTAIATAFPLYYKMREGEDRTSRARHLGADLGSTPGD